MIFSQSARRRRFYAGKHVLVTGASQGIGRSICMQLAAEDAKLSIAARTLSRLEETAQEVRANAADPAKAVVLPVSCDCSDAEAAAALVTRVEGEIGPIDVLINCAGGAHGLYFEKLDAAVAEAQMKTNYFSQLYPARAVFAKMKERGTGGSIVFTSSMAGQAGIFGYSAYTPAKFALRGLAECLYYEGRLCNVHVTVVYPPDTETPGYANEKLTMPPEAIALSSSAGVFSADQVAIAALTGIARRQMRVNVGMDGKLLGILTAGMTPGASLIEFLLTSLLRVLSLLFIADFNRIIANCQRRRTKASEANSISSEESIPGNPSD